MFWCCTLWPLFDPAFALSNGTLYSQRLTSGTQYSISGIVGMVAAALPRPNKALRARVAREAGDQLGWRGKRTN